MADSRALTSAFSAALEVCGRVSTCAPSRVPDLGAITRRWWVPAETVEPDAPGSGTNVRIIAVAARMVGARRLMGFLDTGSRRGQGARNAA
jgi:hypothetical protein